MPSPKAGTLSTEPDKLPHGASTPPQAGRTGQKALCNRNHELLDKYTMMGPHDRGKNRQRQSRTRTHRQITTTHRYYLHAAAKRGGEKGRNTETCHGPARAAAGAPAGARARLTRTGPPPRPTPPQTRGRSWSSSACPRTRQARPRRCPRARGMVTAPPRPPRRTCT